MTNPVLELQKLSSNKPEQKELDQGLSSGSSGGGGSVLVSSYVRNSALSIFCS